MNDGAKRRRMRRTFVASAPASTRVDGPNAVLDSPTLDVAARSVSASFRDFYRKNGRMRRVLQPLAKKESGKARLGGPPRARCIGAWRASEPECSLERQASATAACRPRSFARPIFVSFDSFAFFLPLRRVLQVGARQERARAQSGGLAGLRCVGALESEPPEWGPKSLSSTSALLSPSLNSIAFFLPPHHTMPSSAPPLPLRRQAWEFFV